MPLAPSPAPGAPAVESVAGRPRRWTTYAAVLGGWMLLALLETTKEWIGWRVRGAPRSWALVAAVNLPFWLYWAAATPAVVALGRRFPLLGPGRVRSVAVHLLCSLIAALGHAAVTAAFAVWVLGPAGQLSDPRFLAQFRPLAEGYVLLEMLVYWMILGVAQAVVYHRRFVAARVGEARAEARAARSEARAAEARLQALRMEVDPHFLFNALNAVSSLVRSGDARGATDMLARIGDLLRITLRYGREGSVSLRRELELVREYLEIEAVRIGDRLTVEIDAAPEVLDAAVPPLLLQPLVENAIRHGVARVPGPARLRVRAVRQGDRVRVDVLDSGPGPEPEAPRGTGLRNVADRVAEEFGGAGVLEVTAEPAGGGRATLVFPWTRQGAAPPGSPVGESR